MRTAARVCTIVALALAGCGDDAASEDAGAPDAARDAGAPDAGGGRDAGPGLDAASRCPPPLGEAAPREPGIDTEHPLDDVLRLQHVQVEGTHNSYHIAPGDDVPDWAYTHAPLDVQLGEQGVRQFELDLYWDDACGRVEVYHAGIVDDLSTCRVFTDCLRTLRDWSDAHPAHLPIIVMMEAKFVAREETVDARLAAVEAEILSVWPPELIVSPDDVRGEHATMAEAMAADGWPTLGELRGQILFFLCCNGGVTDAYTMDRTTLDGRLLFAEGAPDAPYTAILRADDPSDAIAGLVRGNLLVRTRADSGGVEARAGDTSRLEAALASGATMVSTDFPAPVDGIDYFVEIPAGTPARCNPITAPPECTSEALEDPSRL